MRPKYWPVTVLAGGAGVKDGSRFAGAHAWATSLVLTSAAMLNFGFSHDGVFCRRVSIIGSSTALSRVSVEYQYD